MLDNVASKYCPCSSYDAIVQGGIFKADLGKPVSSLSIATVTTTASDAGIKDFGASPFIMDAKYGRNVSVVAAGANTTKVIVKGYDYLDQPMTEEFTLNGTTAVVGKKAFKKICEISNPAGTAATITVTGGTLCGLPVRCTQVLATIEDGVKGTIGTLAAPVNTEQTATSGDPRGTLSFTLTGKHLVVIGVADDSIFSFTNGEAGGLHGIPHYFA